MVKSPDIIKLVIEKFDALAMEGIEKFNQNSPVVSHVCFKFTDIPTYQEYAVVMEEHLGQLYTQEFKGKEIIWCKLNVPYEKNGLKLEWLELVEPKFESNSYNGITSIGFIAENIDDTVKIDSSDKTVFFRYQPEDVKPVI